jgi:hypothetical protein
MTTAQVGYTPVYRWVQQGLGETHPPVVATVAGAVRWLLVAQRGTAAALARALPAAQAGSGRSGRRRVRRWWQGPALEPTTIRPALLRLALTLVADAQPVVALDTTWPKGRFRATTLARLQQLQQAVPAGVRWTRVAARGCPSAMRFAQWRPGGTDFRGRLRVSDWGTVAGVAARGAAHWAAGRLRDGQRPAAALGRGRSAQPLVPGGMVVSTAVAPGPRHKPKPGTRRERAKRAQAPAQPRKHTPGRTTPPPSATAQRSAQTWVLFTTAPTVTQAVVAYAGRMSIEETSRDWHHYWAVRAAVVSLPTEAMVGRLIGVVCLASTVQMPLGQRVGVDPMSQQRRAPWTVTDRISWFWRGHQLCTDPGYDWRGWLAQQWGSLRQLGTTAPAPPVPETASPSALAEAA